LSEPKEGQECVSFCQCSQRGDSSVSCAFSPVVRVNFDRYYNQFPREKTIASSAAETAEAAQSALQAMGYDIQAFTPELGTILTKVHSVPIPALCDCGTWNTGEVGGSADSQIKITLTSQGSDTAVAIEHGCGTTFRGQNLYGATTRQETYRCASRGNIEREFWDKLERIAAAKRAAK
jgi:hypothetical protein